MNNKIKFLAEWQYLINLIVSSLIMLILIFTIKLPTKVIDYICYTIPTINTIITVPRFLLWLMAKARVKIDAQKRVKFYECRRVSVTDGEPGTGKTSSNIYTAKILAENCYKKLQVEYSLLSPFARQIESGKDEEKKRHWQEVKESFEFWSKRQKKIIPCLLSSVPLIDYQGRKSMRLTQGHIEQKIKTPYLSVWFNDEVGLNNGADGKRGKNKNLLVSESGRFIRHFFDGYWLNTDQDSGNTAIDIKRVVSLNCTMLEQKAYLKPLFLTWVYNYLCKLLIKKYKNIDERNFNHIISKSRAVNKKYIKFLIFLNKFIKASGFRVYKFIDKGNKIKSNPLFRKEEDKVKTLYAPSLLNVKYDDRCFANSYLAKDKEIEEHIFNNLILSQSELEELVNSNT